LAHNLASPCLGHEPKARVATLVALWERRGKEKKDEMKLLVAY
jgi:hypothetical protein